MESVAEIWRRCSAIYDEVWEKRDRRVDDWLLMASPLPTILLSATYVFLVKVMGPRYMKHREPMNIKTFLVWYNAAQVILSTYIFVQLLRAGWWNDYSFRCQPVDYSDSPKARLMLHCCWIYFLSKFVEFADTFAFVVRKKFSHVSLLHVVHHGIMPISVWPGARFYPGGHSSFFGLCNTFVHILMYAYYMVAALGPKYQKFIWWKQHMTTIQMIQFVAIMAHSFQLIFYDDCNFPWQLSLYIGAHGILFFLLFSQFYVSSYLKPMKKLKVDDDNFTSNGEKHKQNGYNKNLLGNKPKLA